MARQFLCLAAQGNIDLTCNYWKGMREERVGERAWHGGKDVGRWRQPRSATVCNMNETFWLSNCLQLSLAHKHHHVLSLSVRHMK